MIDKFIWNNYELYPSAKISAGVTDGVSVADREKFESRMSSYPEYLRDRIKAMYAAPYYNKDRS